VTVHELDNTEWGFPSNCFVCEAGNPAGLRIAFRYDDEREVVFADFSLAEVFSGAPRYAHGGIVLAILDEAMAWTAIARARAFATTRTTSATFLRPVRIGRPHRVEARLVSQADDALDLAATVTDARGKACAEASSRFARLSARQAADAVGRPPGRDEAGFVRG
jgi:uncharacterized protein (TIGR00369 family)